MRYGIAGGTEFEWVFSNWWPSSRAEPGGRRNCHHRIFSKTDGGREQYLGVVGYDFSPTLAARPGHEPIEYVKNLGRGYVEEGHVRELTQRTEELREVFRERGGICIVWAIHFPPWNHEYASSRLDKYDDVLKAAIKCNIRLILSGHIHDPRPWMQFDKDREIWCAGSACQFGEVLGNWFHTLAIGVEGEELERAQRTNFRRVEDTVEFRGAIRAQSLGEPRWNPLWLPL
jgi:hypothetical protein